MPTRTYRRSDRRWLSTAVLVLCSLLLVVILRPASAAEEVAVITVLPIGDGITFGYRNSEPTIKHAQPDGANICRQEAWLGQKGPDRTAASYRLPLYQLFAQQSQESFRFIGTNGILDGDVPNRKSYNVAPYPKKALDRWPTASELAFLGWPGRTSVEVSASTPDDNANTPDKLFALGMAFPLMKQQPGYEPPEVALIHLGTNDINQGVPWEKSEQAFEEILKILKDPGKGGRDDVIVYIARIIPAGYPMVCSSDTFAAICPRFYYECGAPSPVETFNEHLAKWCGPVDFDSDSYWVGETGQTELCTFPDNPELRRPWTNMTVYLVNQHAGFDTENWLIRSDEIHPSRHGECEIGLRWYQALRETAYPELPKAPAGFCDDYDEGYVPSSPDRVVTRVSTNSNGQQSNGSSGTTSQAISADGRYVVFDSHATNLDNRCNNGESQVYVHDRLTNQTTCVSVSSGSNPVQGNARSAGSVISADGRHVAFMSEATNLDSHCNNGESQVYVRDLDPGTTTCISLNAAGEPGNRGSNSPSLTEDGQKVAFESFAGNLVPGDTAVCEYEGEQYNCRDIFVHDRVARTTALISRSSNGAQGNDDSGGPNVAADGGVVVFGSFATNLDGRCSNGGRQVFARALPAGPTSCLSINVDGSSGSGNSGLPAISADGNIVAFGSDADNLVPYDSNDVPDIFVYDRNLSKMRRVSVDSAGHQGNSNSYSATVSGDGRYVAFTSFSGNLVGGDTNREFDIFTHDLVTGRTNRVSVNAAGEEANRDYFSPSLSYDGRYTSFYSDAEHLVANDDNGQVDVFVYDRGPVASPPGTVDVDIALHSLPPANSAETAAYENIIRYFADALYESSNGARKLGRVTLRSISAGIGEADIVWTQRCLPQSPVAGYGVSYLHVNMCDLFANAQCDGTGSCRDYDFLLDAAHQKGAGYTLAHEWGHYYFGLYDEYKGDSSYNNIFTFPHSTDIPVANSIMSNQWQAMQGNHNWLNFSVPKYDSGVTAQYRVYGASAWQTLSRSPAEDPVRSASLSLPIRPYYPDLVDVAPGTDQDAPVELPVDDARSALEIVWEASLAGAAANASGDEAPFAVQVSSVQGQNLSYPEPILLQAYVHQNLPLSGVGLQGEVLLPDNNTKSISFSDDGRPPDVEKDDGIYSALLPYEADGAYTVRVGFDNEAGAAALVATAFQPSVGVDGQPIPLPAPVPVSDDFALQQELQLWVRDVRADDYGCAKGSAQPLLADNEALYGKIEKAGDKDLFRIRTLASGTTVVRVSNLALGMKPQLRVLGPDGKAVLFDSSLEGRYVNYIFVPLTMVAPGTVVYAQVADASGTAAGGLYEVSAGERLASDWDANFLFLPIISHAAGDR